MKFLGKSKKSEQPAQPQSTGQQLANDGAKISKGTRDVATGLIGGAWHAYTGVLKGTFGYMAKHHNQAGVIVAAGISASVALQNDTVSEYVSGHINQFKQATITTVCENGLDTIALDLCYSPEDKAVIEALTND